jgi:hypothetical protein
MTIYTFLSALLGVILALLLAIRTERDHFKYVALDKFGVFTNILLLIIHTCIAPFFMFIGMICYPAHEGNLGIAGWIVSIFIASATMFSYLGLGISVALRKKGKSKASFYAQFLGIAATAIAFTLFVAFYGNLLQSLN